jgi:hypothetical protein
MMRRDTWMRRRTSRTMMTPPPMRALGPHIVGRGGGAGSCSVTTSSDQEEEERDGDRAIVEGRRLGVVFTVSPTLLRDLVWTLNPAIGQVV